MSAVVNIDIRRVGSGNDAEQAIAHSDSHPRSSAQLETIRMSDVIPTPIVPIWPGFLYQGKVSVNAGLPGDGKSLCAEDIAARMSTGAAWPCGNGRFTRGNVLLMTAEDDPADTIRPRLDVAGADCDAIELIKGVSHRDSTGARTLTAVSLLSDLAAIEERIVASSAKLLIIDPLTSFATSDTNKTADMRRLFDSIALMAARTGIAVLIITHLNKRADARRAMQLVAGSHIIVAAVRAVLVTTRDPNDSARRLVLPIKINIGPEAGGFAFQIVPAHHPTCGEVPRIEWEQGRVDDISADDALVECTPRESAKAVKNSEATQWLKSTLNAGPVPSQEVRALAKQRGISERRFNAAIKTLGAVCEVGGFQGQWSYSIPVSVKKEASV